MTLVKLLLVAAAMFAATRPIAAQEFRSMLFGRVMDPQQALIAGAKVTVVQIETRSSYSATSEAGGTFTLPYLLPGNYEVSAEAAGFKRYVQRGIVISANERVTLDIVLELGAVTESVTVSADAPMLEAASASVGQVLTSRQVENIPINGRNPLVMAHLYTLVTPQGGTVLTRPFDTSHTSDIAIGGTPNRASEFLLDGAPNTTRDSRAAVNPPMDAVMEVKVEGFQSDASFGNTGAGTINVVTKAGTNEYHGAANHYNQVSRLGATPFFNNLTGQGKPFSLWNQFGVVTGGPMIVPKVVNGRNRVFYFFAYEGIRQPNPNPLAGTTWTPAMKNGDFSKLLAINSSYQIYDPLTGVVNGTRVQRQPLANNVVPASRINPIARNLLQYFPEPNAPGGVDGRNNFFGNAPQRDNWDNYLGRIDLNTSAKNKFFMSTRHNGRDSVEQAFYRNIARGRHYYRDIWNVMLDNVHTLTPTMYLNSRVSWTRFDEQRQLLSQGFDLTAVGFPASLAAQSPLPVIPVVEVSGLVPLGDSNHNMTPYDSYQIFNSLSKVVHRHTVKMGADLRLYRESNWQPRYSAGRYQFSTNWTRGPFSNSSSAPFGQEMASYLLGLPTGGSWDLQSYRSVQSGYWSLFVQDDFRVSRALTLNLGLRYEKELPVTERFDRLVVGWDPAAVNSVSVAAKAAYTARPIPEVPAAKFVTTGGLLFANAQNRSPYATHSRNFSPRFGFAWNPEAARKTVVRGGVGIFYFDLGVADFNQTGYSQSTPLVSTLDGNLTPYSTLTNPFPDGIQKPTGAALGYDTFLGRGISSFNRGVQNPYSVRWNFTLQHQLAANFVVEATYLANHAVHLTVSRPLNFTPTQYLSRSPVRDQATIDFLSANVPNPFSGLLPGTNLTGTVTTRDQLLSAYPVYTGVTMNGVNEGSSYSHMALIKLEKRFSNGLQFQCAYQLSHTIQRLGLLNDGDAYLEKRIAPEDATHRAVLNGIYELPFGKGKRFGGRSNAVLERVIGGWLISGMYTLQSGPPIEWGNVVYLGGPLNMDARNISRAFDTTRFVRDSAQQPSRNLRTFDTAFTSLRADGVNIWDASVIKNFPLKERVRLQYRCELFNVANHPLFGPPDVSPTSSTFGRIQTQANQPRRIQMALRLVW
jgi:hypothetical protein